MDITMKDDTRLRQAITKCLNSHDLLGVLDLGAPADEYAPETEDFARLIAAGEPITAEVVAGVWHKWFGDPAGQPAPPSPGMAALAADLQTAAKAGHGH